MNHEDNPRFSPWNVDTHFKCQQNQIKRFKVFMRKNFKFSALTTLHLNLNRKIGAVWVGIIKSKIIAQQIW